MWVHAGAGPRYPPLVYCLHRALYGLKQVSHVWFTKFNYVVARKGFVPSSYDFALFLQTNNAKIIIILLYIDDMIIIGNDIFRIQSFQTFLSQNFEIKDLGRLNYFLGLEITSSTDSYHLS